MRILFIIFLFPLYLNAQPVVTFIEGTSIIDYPPAVTYDTSRWLIPVINGKVNNNKIVDGKQLYYSGWIVWKEEIINGKPVRTKVKYLAFDKKSPIPAPYIVNDPQGELPLNGVGFP